MTKTLESFQSHEQSNEENLEGDGKRLLEIVDELDAAFHPRVGNEKEPTQQELVSSIREFEYKADDYIALLNDEAKENTVLTVLLEELRAETNKMKDLIIELWKQSSLDDKAIELWEEHKKNYNAVVNSILNSVEEPLESAGPESLN